ncbi:MAG: Gfo/Idh/MocA family oxidoreductase [Lentisphaerae bacterium]|nr:Gfo/Idh/MocA family oxidoreductase [Lentisphaerota bacterium]
MKKINVGHIGWTFRDEGPDCHTVAWCDINEAKMAASAVQHPGIAMYTDYRKMVNHPGLELVVISTPNFVHAEQAIAFLNAGKHVFLEKPMGITRDECSRIVQAQRKSGAHLCVDFEMRVSPFARRIRGMIDSGEYGALRRIEFIHHRGCWLEEGNGIWRTRPEKSGGLYFMEPIHEVDIFRYFGGDIEAVQSIVGPNVLPQYRFQDNVCSHFFFKNGALGVILTSHTLSAFTNDPGKWSQMGHDMNMIFTFTKGAIGVDMIRERLVFNRIVEYPAGSGGMRVEFDRIEDYSGGPAGAFCHDISAMRREFIRRMACGQPPVQDGLDAWKSHMVCLAAERSAKEDFRRVKVDYTLPKGVKA